MLERLKNLFRIRIKKLKTIVVYRETTSSDSKKHLWDSYLINSIHKKIYLAANALDYSVYILTQEAKAQDYVLSKNADAEIALGVADYLVYGCAYFTPQLQRVPPQEAEYTGNLIEIENKSFVFSESFLKTILEYERLLEEVLRNTTSVHFILFPNTVLATDDDINALREAIKNKRRLGEAGGLEVFSGNFEIKRLENLLDEYKLPELTQIVEELLCTYFSVPKELLDTSASTYNNKKLAQAEYFSNVIIPAASAVCYRLESEINARKEYREKNRYINIVFDTKNVSMDYDIMEKKVGLIKSLLEIREKTKDSKLDSKIGELIQDL